MFQELLFLLDVFLLFFTNTNQKTSKNVQNESDVNALTVLDVTILYDSLDPKFSSFLVEQLIPTYTQLQRVMRLKLVPAGRTRQSYHHGHYHFLCPNGKNECFTNKVHACQLHNDASVQQSLNFFACLSENGYDKKAIEKCSKKYSIVSFDDLMDCVKSDLGSCLLSGRINQTSKYQEVVDQVPVAVISKNNENEYIHSYGLKHFNDICCHYLEDYGEKFNCQPHDYYHKNGGKTFSVSKVSETNETYT
ncbi:gamma-interferon-inducible lysosomal thiol reductase-like protein [Lycorma delicatula]|uniref:gamma-interferon-inducible lysosomal thiol reductase-like protein n=1 Tax=Lycorma delicatula TaxID=130591 RepID=UPI003F51032E